MNGVCCTTFLRLLFVAMIFPALAHARSNQCNVPMNPVAGLFAVDQELAGLVSSKTVNASLCVNLASHATSTTLPNEELLFDGETLRSELRLYGALGQAWGFGADFTWMQHSGGSLDGLIESWHDTFGLPNGIRDQLPDDALRIELNRDNDTIVSLSSRTRSIGDSRLHLRRTLLSGSRASLSAQLSVKLPTGDSADLSGSGATDVSLGLHGSRYLGNAVLNGRLGVSRLGRSDIAALNHERTIYFAAASVRYSLTEWLAFGAGLNAHSAVLDSELRAYRNPALSLHAEADFSVGRSWQLTLGFGEDLRVATNPDVVFRLMLYRRQR